MTLSLQPEAPATVPALPTRRLFTYDPQERVLLMEIDNTSLSHFCTCARAAEYRLVHSREGTQNMAAKVYGSAKHLYLESRLKGASVTRAEDLMVHYLAMNPVDDPNNWRTATHAIDSMRGYENWYHAQPIEPAIRDGKPLVEIGFRLPLCEVAIGGAAMTYERLLPLLTNPDDCPLVPSLVRVLWTGRFDVIAPFLGETYLWDHKSTSMVGPTFYDDFQLSSQMHGYVWSCRHLYPDLDVRGMRINAIIGRAPSKTGIAHAYERQTYVYSDEHLAEWHRDTQILVSDFLSHLLRGYFPKMTQWCQGRWGQCGYFPVCTSLPESRHIVLDSSLFQDCTWSPLNER
jgi:hypothetical protein